MFFDLSLDLGLPPSIQFHSPSCTANTDHWLLLVRRTLSLTRDTRDRAGEKSSSQANKKPQIIELSDNGFTTNYYNIVAKHPSSFIEMYPPIIGILNYLYPRMSRKPTLHSLSQGTRNRCRLSWLTNSTLVYEPKGGGRGGEGCGVSAGQWGQLLCTMHMEPI